MRLNATSDAQPEYLALQFSYTTAEIEESRFFGETPDPFYFAMPQPPDEVLPIVLTVIDGELRVVRDESPAGARLPNYNSRLFKLADELALADSPA
jgi:hypothetical protein